MNKKQKDIFSTKKAMSIKNERLVEKQTCI